MGMQVGSEANTIPESDGVSTQTPDLTMSFALQHAEWPWEAEDMAGSTGTYPSPGEEVQQKGTQQGQSHTCSVPSPTVTKHVTILPLRRSHRK